MSDFFGKGKTTAMENILAYPAVGRKRSGWLWMQQEELWRERDCSLQEACQKHDSATVNTLYSRTSQRVTNKQAKHIKLGCQRPQDEMHLTELQVHDTLNWRQ